jgi:hypothetical protein
MAILSTTLEGQNWMITPAALALNEPPPARISDQKFVLVLTGVCSLGLKGNQAHDWHRETAEIVPDYVTPLNQAITRFGIPVPKVLGQNVSPMFQLDLWAPFAAVSSVWDQGSTDVGVAVDVWRPSPFRNDDGTFIADSAGNPITQPFRGIRVDVGIRNDQSILYRLSYNITLLGSIRFVLSVMTSHS